MAVGSPRRRARNISRDVRLEPSYAHAMMSSGWGPTARDFSLSSRGKWSQSDADMLLGPGRTSHGFLKIAREDLGVD